MTVPPVTTCVSLPLNSLRGSFLLLPSRFLCLFVMAPTAQKMRQKMVEMPAPEATQKATQRLSPSKEFFFSFYIDIYIDYNSQLACFPER